MIMAGCLALKTSSKTKAFDNEFSVLENETDYHTNSTKRLLPSVSIVLHIELLISQVASQDRDRERRT
jgi:hypothetical protein